MEWGIKSVRHTPALRKLPVTITHMPQASPGHLPGFKAPSWLIALKIFETTLRRKHVHCYSHSRVPDEETEVQRVDVSSRVHKEMQSQASHSHWFLLRGILCMQSTRGRN